MTQGKDASVVRDALTIVAKYPAPGVAKTRLGARIGMEAAADVYRAFLLDLHDRFTPTQYAHAYHLHWAYVPHQRSLAEIVGHDARLLPQRGDDLADRLYFICRDLCAAGYRRAVIVGSDSPHIPATTAARAFALLARADLVLGPADDGGYYLIGLHLHPQPRDVFRGIRMSTPTVLAETLARADRLKLTVVLTEPTFDVDEPEDLERLRVLLADAEQPEGRGMVPHCQHTRQALAALPFAPAHPPGVPISTGRSK